MAWAVALIVVLGVGLLAACWWLVRRPRVLAAAGRGFDEIDRWLAREFGLGSRDRARVRRAVLAGHALSDPALEAAARGLATQVLADQFRVMRTARVAGWFQMLAGPANLAFGIALLVFARHEAPRVTGVLLVVSGALALLAGWGAALRLPTRYRRNAALILRSSESTDPPSKAI